MKKYIALIAFGIGIVSFAQHRPGHEKPQKHQLKKIHPKELHKIHIGPQKPPHPRKDNRDFVRIQPKRSENIALQLPHDLGIHVVIR